MTTTEHGQQATATTPPAVAPLDKSGIQLATRLGWVSYFNDCSSEAIARVLPMYLTAGLGMTPEFVGLIEGLAEALSIAFKALAGWISDRMPSRKPLVVLGYSLSLLSRVLFLIPSAGAAFIGATRLLDRTGKGIRGAPRDAMVADGAALGMSGKAFGITRFLDSLGAVSGIALVLALGVGSPSGGVDAATFRQVVLLALPPGLIAVLLLVIAVPRLPRLTKSKAILSWHVPVPIRGYLLAVLIFSLGNSSDAFLILRARELGFGMTGILLLMLAFNGLAASLSVFVGKLSDRIGRTRILALGWLTYGCLYLAFGAIDSMTGFAIGMFIYGAFYGFTEGTEKALLADLLPPHERGTGYGALQLTTGLAALPASLITGYLMTTVGARAAFGTCAAFAIAGLFLLMVWRVRNRALTPSH